MNEELQSTNDELQVINEELRGRTEELDKTNGFLGSVLRSLGSAVIVLTDELRVRVWSPEAQDLWGLRPEEAESREFLALDIGLPTPEFGPWLRRVLHQADVGPSDDRGEPPGEDRGASGGRLSDAHRRGHDQRDNPGYRPGSRLSPISRY